jgi:hypothetical protein
MLEVGRERMGERVGGLKEIKKECVGPVDNN